jgi:hypothetical protein
VREKILCGTCQSKVLAFPCNEKPFGLTKIKFNSAKWDYLYVRLRPERPASSARTF